MDNPFKNMNKVLKYSIFILMGASIALLLLGLYSWFFNPFDSYGQPETLPPVKVNDKSVFITGISGEVYIIRNERIIHAEIGDSLKSGDALKVVDQSYCQIQFSDRGTAGLESNTVMLMKKLVNAQKDVQVHTEVLMGSMLYRVKKHSDKDEFLVESDGVLYDIKGTEFLVSRSSDGTLLAVREGTVQYSVEDITFDVSSVSAGEQIFFNKEQREKSAISALDENSSRVMDNLEIIDSVSIAQGDWPVTIGLETYPNGSDIYLDGRKIANSWFSGLFNVGSELDFLVRKRGYRDEALHVSVVSGEDKIYLIELEPSNLEETLQESTVESFEGLLSRMELLHKQAMEQQQESYTRELERRESSIRQLENETDNLTQSKKELELEIEERDKQISELRTLMTQIQELSNQ